MVHMKLVNISCHMSPKVPKLSTVMLSQYYFSLCGPCRPIIQTQLSLKFVFKEMSRVLSKRTFDWRSLMKKKMGAFKNSGFSTMDLFTVNVAVTVLLSEGQPTSYNDTRQIRSKMIKYYSCQAKTAYQLNQVYSIPSKDDNQRQ